jgi:hypothetical protein
MVFCFALYPFTRGRAPTFQVVLACVILFCIISLHTCCARTVQVVLAYDILFCIISIHTWSCTHFSWCHSVCYFVLHYIYMYTVFDVLICSIQLLCDKVCQWLAVGRLFSPDNQVSSTNKTDRHDITEILLKVALNIITLTITLHLFDCCYRSG